MKIVPLVAALALMAGVAVPGAYADHVFFTTTTGDTVVTSPMVVHRRTIMTTTEPTVIQRTITQPVVVRRELPMVVETTPVVRTLPMVVQTEPRIIKIEKDNHLLDLDLPLIDLKLF